MSSFEGVDFYQIDELLSDEEKAIRGAVRGWVDDRVLPVIEEHYQKGTFPVELAAEMGEMGFLGANLDGYECPGLNNVSYGLICQELERGDSAVRSFASVQGSLVMFPIHAYGSRGAEAAVAAEACQGRGHRLLRAHRARLRLEPCGHDHARTSTQATTTCINGAKMWITNGTLADVAVVWAKLEGEVHGFLVERGMDGFSAPEMKGKHSLRASVTSASWCFRT